MADRHVRRQIRDFRSHPGQAGVRLRVQRYLTSGRGDRYRDQRHDRLVGRKSRFPRGNHRANEYSPGPFRKKWCAATYRETEQGGFVDLHSRNVCRVAGLTRELRIRNIRFTCDLLRVQRVHVSIASAHPRHLSYVNYSAREKRSR